ncbi:MAG TPA: oxygenase MpaB family protein [Phenylobacterium sp.]|nr:oxygenase MpaB family protein [Phenylobacterium sp.]
MPVLRSAIQQQVRAMFGTEKGEVPLEDPPGDAGLFGPRSAAWRVHGDLATMMVGGVAALQLQMLHPGALAGVWDHSNFRQDMQGRLRRTARFMSGTTYAPTQEAVALIDKVRAIHDQIHGRLPDGRPYSANDPDLLTWVHVAGAWCFLAAYVRHRDPAFPLADQDRYFDETAVVGLRLGAQDVPRSLRAAEAYLRDMRPQLRCDERTREVIGALLSQRWSSPAVAQAGRLIFQAAEDLLPPWAAEMHGFQKSLGRGPGLWLGVRGLGAALRWALPNSPERRARRRKFTS